MAKEKVQKISPQNIQAALPRDVDEVRAQGTGAVAAQFVRELFSLHRQEWGNLWGYVFIAPAVLMYLVFQAWPILRGLFMAFSDYRWIVRETHGLAGFNGLDNWIEMFQDGTFWHSFWIALKFSLIVTPITLILSLTTAVLISQVRNGILAGTYRVIAYLPVILPISVAMLVWAKLFDFQFGYLNVLLQAVGVENPPNWLGSPSTALYAMAMPTVWSRFGSWTLLFIIGIYNINREIYEAARVDGANGWRQFFHITMPLLKPVFVLVLVLGIGVVSATEESMILFQGTTGGPAESALTTGVYLYRIAFIHGDMRMGYAATMSLFLGLVNMLITLVVFKTLQTERA
jgi:multiple sugar transport system permease protein